MFRAPSKKKKGLPVVKSTEKLIGRVVKFLFALLLKQLFFSELPNMPSKDNIIVNLPNSGLKNMRKWNNNRDVCQNI